MQIGRFLRRTFTDPIRDAGRGVRQIAQGNVRQGLRDLSGATKLAAAFIPGGAAAAGALGALGGAMGAERGASFGDVARGAAGGAVTGMGGRAIRQGVQGQLQGLFTGGGGPLPGGAGVQAANIPGPGMMTGGVTPLSSAPLGSAPLGSAPLPGVPPVLSGRAAMDSLGRAQQAIPGLQAPATASMSGLSQAAPNVPVNFGFTSRGRGAMDSLGGAQRPIPGLQSSATASMSGLSRAAEPVGRSLGGVAKGAGSVARDVVSGIAKESPSRLSRLGSFVTENPELSAGIARGAGTAFAGAQQADVARGELDILRRREERAEREEQEERERRQRVAQMLAPLFQQMQQRQYFS